FSHRAVETGKSPASRAALILVGGVLTMIRQEISSRGNDDTCPNHSMESLQLAPHPSRISLRSMLATLSPHMRAEGRARRSRAKVRGFAVHGSRNDDSKE
ncbi:MAG TPA: hypothetical protein VNR41_06145, partial [Xanthobacteraceae bacterium]|nr:hypothetical protein [Xanthobacteraceae bacterium]